jgi:hypothetical protein
MNSSLNRVGWIAFAALLWGCAAGDGSESTGSDTLTQRNVTATQSITANPERQAGLKMIDVSNLDTVDLGTTEGWALQFDKGRKLVIASNGKSVVAFDPNSFDDATADSLIRAGVPASIVKSWEGYLCRAACWGAAAVGCAAISVSCAAGTTITIGGFALPCSWAIVAACGASTAGASVCSDWCTSAFG